MSKDKLLRMEFDKKANSEIALESTTKAHLLYPLILILLFLSGIVGYPFLLYKFFRGKVKKLNEGVRK